jgi:peptidoglycan biosynthesis protein MviN/MurJ (putative lipid II flippase)
MRHRLKRLETRRMLAMLGKVAVASAALAAICWASRHWLLADWATQAFIGKLGSLVLTVVAGVLVFLGCGAAMRIGELNGLVDVLRRRLRRSG